MQTQTKCPSSQNPIPIGRKPSKTIQETGLNLNKPHSLRSLKDFVFRKRETIQEEIKNKFVSQRRELELQIPQCGGTQFQKPKLHRVKRGDPFDYLSEKLSLKSTLEGNAKFMPLSRKRVKSVPNCKFNSPQNVDFLPSFRPRREAQKSEPSLLKKVKQRYFQMQQAKQGLSRNEFYLTPHLIEKRQAQGLCNLYITQSSPPKINISSSHAIKNQGLSSKSVPKLRPTRQGLKFIETKLSTIQSSVKLIASPDSSLTRILWHNRVLGTGKKLGMHSQNNAIKQLEKHEGDMTGPPQELLTLGDLEISNISKEAVDLSLYDDSYYQYCKARPSEDTRELQQFLKIMP